MNQAELRKLSKPDRMLALLKAAGELGSDYRCGGPLRQFDAMDEPMKYVDQFDPPLDPGIADAVLALQSAGIETFESCEGGAGHAYPEPTVRFHGHRSEGFKALAAAMSHGLNVTGLRRVWPIVEGEPTGPWWELTFFMAASNERRAEQKQQDAPSKITATKGSDPTEDPPIGDDAPSVKERG